MTIYHNSTKAKKLLLHSALQNYKGRKKENLSFSDIFSSKWCFKSNMGDLGSATITSLAEKTKTKSSSI